MKQATIKSLKKGEFFTLNYHEYSPVTETEVKESQVWIRGDYDRESKTYSCTKFDDFCHEHFFKGSKIVWTDFVF